MNSYIGRYESNFLPWCISSTAKGTSNYIFDMFNQTIGIFVNSIIEEETTFWIIRYLYKPASNAASLHQVNLRPNYFSF